MKYRKLGKTGFDVSEVSLGTWQVGGKWGSEFDDQNAEEIINASVDQGVYFIDTADVYSNGKSEAAVAKVVKNREEEIFVATKCGRRIQPHVNEEYTPEKLTSFVEDSLQNTGFEALDLIQLHCPPKEVYYRPEIFETFDKLKDQGKIRHLGVSVEKVEHALKAIEYPNVTTVQIIFNMFRHRPAELFFREAKARNIGVIVRVPLASGLLSGKMTKDMTFGEGDHRHFNREGEAFDKGETFSGVNFEKGIDAVEERRKHFDEDQGSLAQWAIRWVLMFPAVSTVIPGASSVEHAIDNAKAADLPPLTSNQMQAVKHLYDTDFRATVHHRW